MNNNEMIINENEDEDNSDSSPEEIKEKIKYNNKDNKIEENEREFDLDNEITYILSLLKKEIIYLLERKDSRVLTAKIDLPENAKNYVVVNKYADELLKQYKQETQRDSR